MESAFKTVPDPLKVTGMLEDWQDGIGARITGQTLPMFAVMLPLAAAVLDILDWGHSPIFELAAPAGAGALLLQTLAASVTGTVAQEPIGLAELFTNLDHHLVQHAGRTMLIGDPQLALAGAASQKTMTKVRDTVIGLSAGAKLPSDGRSTSPASRGICLIISQASLVEHFGAETEVGLLLKERITTLRLADKSLMAVFNRRHDGYRACDRLTDELRIAAGQYQCTAFRHFIAKLVQARADDEAALKACLQRYRNAFNSRSDIRRNDHIGRRNADNFALVYAAAKLAKSYDILPDALEIGSAVLACFNMHRAARAAPNPYLAQLEAIAARPDTIHLEEGREVDPALLVTAKAFVRHFSNRRALIISPKVTGERISDWNESKPPVGLANLMKSEGNHFSVKVRLPGGEGQRRMHVFRLPKEPPKHRKKTG